MNSFEHFQRATCLIADGNQASAAEDLQAALQKLDADPKNDPSLRADLAALLATVSPKPQPQASAQRAGTKQAALIAMLQAPEGATLDEIVAATGWQKHTARGALSGALKKRLGLTIHAEPEPGRGRVYRIADDEAS